MRWLALGTCISIQLPQLKVPNVGLLLQLFFFFPGQLFFCWGCWFQTKLIVDHNIQPSVINICSEVHRARNWAQTPPAQPFFFITRQEKTGNCNTSALRPTIWGGNCCRVREWESRVASCVFGPLIMLSCPALAAVYSCQNTWLCRVAWGCFSFAKDFFIADLSLSIFPKSPFMCLFFPPDFFFFFFVGWGQRMDLV